MHVDAQRLMGTLLVDVEAKDDVQVFWSIFGANNPGVVITYTVSATITPCTTVLNGCYGLYLEVQYNASYCHVITSDKNYVPEVSGK